MKLIVLTGLLVRSIFASRAASSSYCWLSPTDSSETLSERIPTPAGFSRMETSENGVGTYATWLRGVPLKSGKPPVRLYNGRIKSREDVHCAVININTGERDLQQCADAAIRLRAEYLYSQGYFDGISFNFTSGDTARYRDWINGLRPKVAGNKVTWGNRARPDSSYASFREYLDLVFMYAGSYSLGRDLQTVRNIEQMQIGDLFVQGGFPGHVIMVLDMAIDTATDGTLFLLAQGFTPAQDIHVLNNLNDPDLSPWYRLDDSPIIVTPEWRFKSTELMRFR